MDMQEFFAGHTLFSKAWSLTVREDGTNLIGRMNGAMMALMPKASKSNYKEEILHFAEHIGGGVIRAKEVIERDEISDVALMTICMETAMRVRLFVSPRERAGCASSQWLNDR